MDSSSSWQLAKDSLWPLLQGMVLGTIPLTGISFLLGLVVALLVALARISSVKFLRAIAATFVSLIRGTPLLLQLFIIFYGLPSLGIVLDPWPSAIVAFSLNVGGYAAETIRAAILSVPKGQWEAAATVGLSRGATLRQIVLPQAARVAVPPLSNTLISLVKDTSLASAVLVTEILRKAQELAAPTFQFFLLYGIAAIYYWIVSQLLTVLQGQLEKRLNQKVAR
jgi:His/Glu/Gln/Arg/opine family amino acid ABC transporter permease subunit